MYWLPWVLAAVWGGAAYYGGPRSAPAAKSPAATAERPAPVPVARLADGDPPPPETVADGSYGYGCADDCPGFTLGGAVPGVTAYWMDHVPGTPFLYFGHVLHEAPIPGEGERRHAYTTLESAVSVGVALWPWADLVDPSGEWEVMDVSPAAPMVPAVMYDTELFAPTQDPYFWTCVKTGAHEITAVMSPPVNVMMMKFGTCAA